MNEQMNMTMRNFAFGFPCNATEGDSACIFFLEFYLSLFTAVLVFVAAHGLSLVSVSRGTLWLRRVGFWLRWLLVLRSGGCRHVATVVVACGLSCSGVWYVGSFKTRD